MSLYENWVSSSILQDYHPHKDQHEKHKNITPRITSSIRNRRKPPPIPVIGIEIHPMQFLPLLLILFLPFAAPLKEAQLILQPRIIHKQPQISANGPVLHFDIRAPPEEPLEVFIWNQQGRSRAVIGFPIDSQLFAHASLGRKTDDLKTKKTRQFTDGFSNNRERQLLLLDSFEFNRQNNLVAYYGTASFERLIPGQPEVLAIDLAGSGETDSLIAPRILSRSQILTVQNDRLRNAADREITDDLDIVPGHTAAFQNELDLRMLIDVKEVARTKVFVTLFVVREDRLCFDDCLTGGENFLLFVKSKLARKLLERTFHIRDDEVLYRKAYLRMRCIHLEFGGHGGLCYKQSGNSCQHELFHFIIS